MNLWRVYTHTADDESVSERLVSANTDAEARAKALANVKAQNLGKGEKTQLSSRRQTRVLCCRPCGKDGVLTISRIPLAAIEAISQKV